MDGTRRIGRIPVDPLDRFLAQVDQTADCWRWLGAPSAQGYGRFRPQGSAPKVAAHRWAYEHFVGPIPDGLEIDHLCRVKLCVNPSHLEAVTAAENIQRRDRAHQLGAFKITFSCGHDADENNSYRYPDGGRTSCRLCGRDRMRARRAEGRKQ